MVTRRLVLGASLAAALFQASSEGLAQARPDFAGQWSFDWTSVVPLAPGAAFGRGRGAPRGGNFGEAFTATQDARTLLVTYTDLDRPVRQEFALDGRET